MGSVTSSVEKSSWKKSVDGFAKIIEPIKLIGAYWIFIIAGGNAGRIALQTINDFSLIRLSILPPLFLAFYISFTYWWSFMNTIWRKEEEKLGGGNESH